MSFNWKSLTRFCQKESEDICSQNNIALIKPHSHTSKHTINSNQLFPILKLFQIVRRRKIFFITYNLYVLATI